MATHSGALSWKPRVIAAAFATAVALALAANAAPADAGVISATTDGVSAQLNLDGADDVVSVSVENGLLVHDPVGDGLKSSADWDSATPGASNRLPRRKRLDARYFTGMVHLPDGDRSRTQR